MRKITLLLFTFLTISLGYAQTNLFSDDFESYPDFVITGFGGWLTLDLDGLPTYTPFDEGQDPEYTNAGAPMAFQIFNPATTTPPATNSTSGGEVRNINPRSGAKYAASPSAVPDFVSGNIANNDWLISPAVALAESGNTASFYVKAISNTYGNESYEVGVYIGSGTPTGSGNFTIIGGTRTATYPDWELVTIDLSAYDNQTVRVGIHYISSDVYMMMVDDFSIDTSLSINEFTANTFTHSYDRFLDVLNLQSINNAFENIQIFNLVGQEVLNKKLTRTSENVSLGNLKDGIYLAKITIEGRVQTLKFLKQ